MMSAISAAENGADVTIFEKMEKLGKKLLITGKGRCNVTNNIDISEFMDNILHNNKFLYSAFNNYTNNDIVSFLESQGVKTKVERGERVFPVSDNSHDVLNAFLKKLKSLNVKIFTNSNIKEIVAQNGKVCGIVVNDKIIEADKIILATGGASYPVTGSNGDGYKLAKKLGHKIVNIKPSLVPLECKKSLNLCQDMQGLSLKNVGLKVMNGDKIIYQDFGEMLFTHFGVSGPIILSSSSVILRQKDIESLLKNSKIKLVIDLKPALDEEKLNNRILRDFTELKNKEFKNSLNKLLPQKMIEPIIELSKINPEKRVNEVTQEERKRLVNLLKNLEIAVSGFRGMEEAIITAGGIDVKEINPKTMESKLVKGLYFAGEIIDVDGLTGGFNLQIAYSTGYTAGKLL